MILAELTCLRADDKAKADQIAALNGTISVMQMKIDLQKEQSDFFKSAATKGISIDTNNSAIIDVYKQQIAAALQRNTEVEKDNADLRASRDKRAVVSFVAGLGLGAVAGHQFGH